MEQEHLIIVAILAVILYMLMKHSSNCNCSSCMNDKVVGGMPAHIRMGRFNEGLPDPSTNPLEGRLQEPSKRIRYSDKYIGAGQHIKQHLRHDSRQGMFSGMFSGSPSHHIRMCDDSPGCTGPTCCK
jgi:hypothetical protein